MRIAINGLGRIGRSILKIGLDKGIEIVAVNDLTDTKNLGYLIKHDSVYGSYNKNVEIGRDFLKIDGKKILVFSEKDPSNLPWKKLNIDVVIESTGLFRSREKAGLHLNAGAKKVLISAPSDDSDIVVVLGVNDNELKKNHKIISNASCTTNCLAPIVKIINDKFKIKKGFMTTVHAYTNDQRILDVPHKSFRRGRAAAENIIPTTTGATKAVVKVIPSLKGKLNGVAMRVPVKCGSIVDFVCEVSKNVCVEEVNEELRKASNGKLKGILEFSNEELVSSDIIGKSASSIVDGLSTQVIGGKGNFVKILSWYDNEHGYSSRMVDLIKLLSKLK